MELAVFSKILLLMLELLYFSVWAMVREYTVFQECVQHTLKLHNFFLISR